MPMAARFSTAADGEPLSSSAVGALLLVMSRSRQDATRIIPIATPNRLIVEVMA
jgi:hypothetical protein